MHLSIYQSVHVYHIGSSCHLKEFPFISLLLQIETVINKVIKVHGDFFRKLLGVKREKLDRMVDRVKPLVMVHGSVFIVQFMVQ